MSADVVNLRQARKARRRAHDEATAAVNRANHGRTKAERGLQVAETKRAGRVLDGARIVPDTEGDDH